MRSSYSVGAKYFTFPDAHPNGWTVRKPRGTSKAPRCCRYPDQPDARTKGPRPHQAHPRPPWNQSRRRPAHGRHTHRQTNRPITGSSWPAAPVSREPHAVKTQRLTSNEDLPCGSGHSFRRSASHVGWFPAATGNHPIPVAPRVTPVNRMVQGGHSRDGPCLDQRRTPRRDLSSIIASGLVRFSPEQHRTTPWPARILREQ